MQLGITHMMCCTEQFRSICIWYGISYISPLFLTCRLTGTKRKFTDCWYVCARS